MEIDYIKGLKTDKIFGMSKYQMEIHKRLDIKLNVIDYNSLTHFFEKKYSDRSKSRTDTDTINIPLSRSLNYIMNIGKITLKTIDKYRYVPIVKNKVKKGNIKHITSQELAFLLNSILLENVIVTCYDLIPLVYDKERSLIWKENMNGLKKADIIITISRFSKDEIVKHLDYPEDRIKIVYPGVDHSVYYEKRDKKILREHNISNEDKLILYVGSETPRMNVPVLIKAFSKLKKRLPNIKLVKIGESQSYGARENILKLIKDFNLQDDVIFEGYIPEGELPLWYNASDVLVYPCEYAGFGLPPLEAMACGTPVVTSNTTSLPEVVGDAGIMIDPNDIESMSEMIYQVLTDSEFKNELVKKGIERSKLFNWDESARRTRDIYESFDIL